MAGVSDTTLGHYLKVLQELEFIERREPVLATAKSKSGRYFVQDHFLRFYYRFVVPQIGPIERGYQEAAAKKIYAELQPFLEESVLAELCREWVWATAIAGQLDFVPEFVGSYQCTYHTRVCNLIAIVIRKRADTFRRCRQK